MGGHKPAGKQTYEGRRSSKTEAPTNTSCSCLNGVVLFVAAEPLICSPVVAFRLSTRSGALTVVQAPVLSVVQLMAVVLALPTVHGTAPSLTMGTRPSAVAGSPGANP